MKLVDINKELAEAYMKTAEETLELLGIIMGKSNMWSATMTYYCKYFATYSLLMTLGVKCEIHDCTIELCRLFEREGILPEGYADTLEKDKMTRIDNQYYLKDKEADTSGLAEFILTVDRIRERLDSKSIQNIRKMLAEI